MSREINILSLRIPRTGHLTDNDTEDDAARNYDAENDDTDVDDTKNDELSPMQLLFFRFSCLINPVELCDDGEWKVMTSSTCLSSAYLYT